MSYEQYWEKDPYLVLDYRDADTRRRRDKNEFMWLQGMYIYEGFAAIMHNAFSKKGTKAQHYPKEPYRITPMTEEEKKEAAERERKKAIASFNSWKSAWDKSHG